MNTSTIALDATAKHPDFTYDERAGRYRYADSGKFVPRAAMLSLLEQRSDTAKSELKAVADQLEKGDVDLRQWQKLSAESIKTIHIQQYLIGVGGIVNMQPEDYLAIGRELKSQYGYLREFAVDLKAGTMSPAMMQSRLMLYANAARVSRHRGEQTIARRNGKAYAVRYLAMTLHCKDCPNLANKVLPIDELPLPTQQCECRANCACRIEFLTLEEAVAFSGESQL